MSGGSVRRPRGERVRTATRVLLAVVACTLVPAGRAAADWRPAGAITAGLLVESGSTGGKSALGGGLAADLWQSFGALRLGFNVGLNAVSGTASQAIVFTPIALSSAVVLDSPRMSFEIRIRAGGFGGAVHDHGFVSGLYLNAGVFLDIALSDEALLGVGGDLHLLVAGERSTAFDSRAFFAPGITLVYRPASTAPNAH